MEDTVVRLLEPGPTQLERSAAYRAHAAWLEAAATALAGSADRLAA
jgi:hypothetical protein